MDPITSHPTTTDTVVFRPSKKRKIYRRRGSSLSAPPSSASMPDPTSNSPCAQTIDSLIAQPIVGEAVSEEDDIGPSVAEVLRLQKARLRQRAGGVEFRTTSATGRRQSTGEDDPNLHEDEDISERTKEGAEGIEPRGVESRFAKQTGLIGDVNKHMMAYIESELAKRSHSNPQFLTRELSHSTASNQVPEVALSEQNISSQGLLKGRKQLERQPASLGKLLEIDLGNEVRNQNVERTEQARRRLDGEAVDAEDGESSNGTGPRAKHVRLGRDGKPWRGRKRRTSEDIRRDQLVEEVLRENRLELYEPPSQAKANSDNQSAAADERIAEEFRREFMDAISSRHRRKPAGTQSSRGTGGKKEEELLKGPKLGGSRSARAAMREAALKEAKKR